MKNVYLVGFMATGKTAAAKLLAERLGRPCVDLDRLIEEQEKMPIRDIFVAKGEAYFRGVEKTLVCDLSKQEGQVIACGGGTFVDSENIERLLRSGLVICLTASPEVILKRAARYTHRPLLNTPDPLRSIKELLEKRADAYAKAHMTIDGDKLSVDEMVDKILKELRQHESS